MKTFHTQGIILQKYDIFEQDRSYTLFTESHGKIRAIAKGARKITSRRASHLEFLNLCHFQLYEVNSNKILITQCQTLETYQKIKKDLQWLSAASYIAEITNKLIYEHQQNEDIFELLKNALRLLNEKQPYTMIVSAFTTKLLTLLGLLPNFLETKMEYRLILSALQKRSLQDLSHGAAKPNFTEEKKQKLLQTTNRLLYYYVPQQSLRSAKFL